jgi:hypothetical protein
MRKQYLIPLRMLLPQANWRPAKEMRRFPLYGANRKQVMSLHAVATIFAE